MSLKKIVVTFDEGTYTILYTVYTCAQSNIVVVIERSVSGGGGIGVLFTGAPIITAGDVRETVKEVCV